MSVRSVGYGLPGKDGKDGKDGVAVNGTNGSNGVRGSVWTAGTGVPVETANVGDMYLDTATGDVWRMS